MLPNTRSKDIGLKFHFQFLSRPKSRAEFMKNWNKIDEVFYLPRLYAVNEVEVFSSCRFTYIGFHWLYFVGKAARGSPTRSPKAPSSQFLIKATSGRAIRVFPCPHNSKERKEAPALSLCTAETLFQVSYFVFPGSTEDIRAIVWKLKLSQQSALSSNAPRKLSLRFFGRK